MFGLRVFDFLIIEGVVRMKAYYGRIAAVLGAASMCVLLVIGCGGQKPAEEMKSDAMAADSMLPRSVSFRTIPQVGTISYPTDTKANKIDLSMWICTGTSPNSGNIPVNTIVNITGMSAVPGKGQGPTPPLPLIGITDQAVQVTPNDTTSVK